MNLYTVNEWMEHNLVASVASVQEAMKVALENGYKGTWLLEDGPKESVFSGWDLETYAETQKDFLFVPV